MTNNTVEARSAAEASAGWRRVADSGANSWPAFWTMLGTTEDRNRSIAAAGNADGRPEVFATAPDDTTWHFWQTSPGGTWIG